MPLFFLATDSRTCIARTRVLSPVLTSIDLGTVTLRVLTTSLPRLFLVVYFSLTVV